MGPIAQTDPGFVFEALPPIEEAVQPHVAAGLPANPLGPLAALPGTWVGHGFNQIWRPHHPSASQDRFLELNLTDETIVFTAINGGIPNRGLAQGDITMHGITYMQQIAEHGTNAGLHIEPGIWAVVPVTTDPNEPATVVRMASIPHGTTILAQGTTQFLQGGPQTIPNNNILPFPIGGGSPFTFPETDLSTPTQFRHATAGVTQTMVDNPNSVLQSVIHGKPMKNRTFIHITTTHNPIKGGGTSNTAFLSNSTNPSGGNADAAQVDATFWIETLPGPSGQPDILQLQYTQTVILNFNGLSWPHITVGTLVKQ